MGASAVFRLDYISCVLTIAAAILLGQKRWQGWLLAGINSVLVCDIALHTSQTGFIPANVFCVALYAWNILGWRKKVNAGRERDRLPPLIDLAASSRNIVLAPPARCPLPAPHLETLCCERGVPSLLEESNPSSRQLLDLHSLLSCAINPGRDRTP